MNQVINVNDESIMYCQAAIHRCLLILLYAFQFAQIHVSMNITKLLLISGF